MVRYAQMWAALILTVAFVGGEHGPPPPRPPDPPGPPPPRPPDPPGPPPPRPPDPPGPPPPRPPGPPGPAPPHPPGLGPGPDKPGPDGPPPPRKPPLPDIDAATLPPLPPLNFVGDPKLPVQPETNLSKCNGTEILRNTKRCNTMCCSSPDCICAPYAVSDKFSINSYVNTAFLQDSYSIYMDSINLDMFCNWADCVMEEHGPCLMGFLLAHISSTTSKFAEETGGLHPMVLLMSSSNLDTFADLSDICRFRTCPTDNYITALECIERLTCRNSSESMCTVECQRAKVECARSADCDYMYESLAGCTNYSTDSEVCGNIDELCLAVTIGSTLPPASPAGFNPLYLAIAVGVVTALLIAGFLYYYCTHRSKFQILPEDDTATNYGRDSVGYNSAPPGRMNSKEHRALVVQYLAAGKWQKGRLLGRGQFGSVYLALLPHGTAVAVKQIDASNHDEEDRKAYMREIGMMQSLDHPNIVRYFFTSYDDREKLISIFMEFVSGGSLAKLVRSMPVKLNEDQGKVYTRQILLGLEYLHSNGIIHRDIKGDNVLIDTTEAVCKISDFGSSKRIQATLGPSVAMTITGTPNWMAPEVITNAGQQTHNEKVDIWSIGCTVVEILNRGRPPWPEFNSQWAAIYHIANASTEGLPEGIPEDLSEECLAFIRRCLQRTPSERASVAELLEHPWVEEADTFEIVKTTSIPVMDEHIQQMVERERARKNSEDGQSDPGRVDPEGDKEKVVSIDSASSPGDPVNNPNFDSFVKQQQQQMQQQQQQQHPGAPIRPDPSRSPPLENITRPVIPSSPDIPPLGATLDVPKFTMNDRMTSEEDAVRYCTIESNAYPSSKTKTSELSARGISLQSLPGQFAPSLGTVPSLDMKKVEEPRSSTSAEVSR